MNVARLCRWMRRRNDSGSMPLAVLLTVVGLGLGVVMASVLTSQQSNTRSEIQRVDAVNAAQTGLEVALGALRSATHDGQPGSGDPAALPCDPLTGRVGPAGAATYSVQVIYLSDAPPSGDIAWAQSHALDCAPPLSTLAYAFVFSTGTDGPTVRRTLTATYTFTTTSRNENLAGGQIHLFARDAEPTNLCLAVTGQTPGSKVVTRFCDSTSPKQRFAYEANLNLVLKGSNPRLCVDAGAGLTVNTTITLQPCAATDVTWQQWGSNDFSAFTITKPDLSFFCMQLVTGATESDILLKAGKTEQAPCEDSWNSSMSFSVDSDVGSGRAGADTHQLVNLKEFSKCIDVTGDDVDEKFLVVFPCKQKPYGEVLWNQHWMLPEIPVGETSAAGAIYTTVDKVGDKHNGETYCLTSPGTTTGYVTTKKCTIGAVPTEPMTWIVYSDTGRQTTSYRIESAYNRVSSANFCMAPDPEDLWDGGSGNSGFNLKISKLNLAVCDGGALQKWNAALTTAQSSLTDVVER
jgi:hypothetical protein